MASRLSKMILQDPSRSTNLTSPGAGGNSIKFNPNPSSPSASPRGAEDLLISPRPIEKSINKTPAPVNIAEAVIVQDDKQTMKPIVPKAAVLKTAVDTAIIPVATQSVKSPISSKFGSVLQKCTFCQKSVCPSSPEELIAVNKIWHKSCFVCGGTSDKEDGGGHGCKKTLTLQNYLAHDNQPYCIKCHGLVNTIKASSDHHNSSSSHKSVK